MKAPTLILFALAMLDCQQKTEVGVECVGIGTGFQCTATHRTGSADAKACWDVTVRCQNGNVARANGCQTVQPEGKSSLFMPSESFNGNANCDQGIAVNVENIRVTAE